MKRISILLVAVLALVVAACTSEQAAPSEEESQPAATQSATPEPSSEAPEPSEDGAGESEVAIPSFDLNGDPELAARFPDTVGGEPLEVQSFRGDTFAQIGGADPAFEAFLESVDAELSDVSVAFGGAASAESETFLSVGAFRVLGANGTTWSASSWRPARRRVSWAASSSRRSPARTSGRHPTRAARPTRRWSSTPRTTRSTS